MADEKSRSEEIQLVDEVGRLSDEVRELAFKLAWHLAKAKAGKGGESVNKLEPEFIRLVNGTIRVVQEVSSILHAARDGATMAYEPPSGSLERDHVEAKLRTVQGLCAEILAQIRHSGAVDYRP